MKTNAYLGYLITQRSQISKVNSPCEVVILIRKLSQIMKTHRGEDGGQQKAYFNTQNVYARVGTWSKNAKNMFT